MIAITAISFITVLLPSTTVVLVVITLVIAASVVIIVIVAVVELAIIVAGPCDRHCLRGGLGRRVLVSHVGQT
jgi:hypothetical protein